MTRGLWCNEMSRAEVNGHRSADDDEEEGANILSRGRLMAFSLPLPLIIIIQSTGDTLRRNYLLIYLPEPLFLPYFQDQWPSDCVDECTADVDPIGGGSGRVYAWPGQVPQPVRA